MLHSFPHSESRLLCVGELFIETLRGNVRDTVRVRVLLRAMLSCEWQRLLLQCAHRSSWQICCLRLVVVASFFAVMGLAQRMLLCYRRFGRARGCRLQGSRCPPRSWSLKGLYLTQNYSTTLTCDVTSCVNDIIKKINEFRSQHSRIFIRRQSLSLTERHVST